MVVGQIAIERDTVVIGGGPAGYTAALRLAKAGREVTLIEAGGLGGVCLNDGCIPSKVFAHAAKKLSELKSYSRYGIEVDGVKMNDEKLRKEKDRIVQQLRRGIESLCNGSGIEVIKGKATFLSPDRIGVETGDAYSIYSFQSAIIATGASPIRRKFDAVDRNRIVDCLSLYNLTELPESIVLFGNDYIALEAAFSFKQLGSDVTLMLEDGKGFGFDGDIEREMETQLKKRKINVQNIAGLVKMESIGDRVRSVWKDGTGDEKVVESSHIYVQAKYRPNTSGLGLERIGVTTDEEGWILVDRKGRTTVKGIYAAGDVTGGELMAVKAIKQGKTIADSIAGEKAEWDFTYFPKAIHSNPPVATIGLTEEEAKGAGFQIKVGNFPLAGNGYAVVTGKRDGFIKVISDRETDRILGIHIIGEGAVELLTAATLSLEMVARTEDLRFPLYPHPSMNEGLLEAVESLDEKAVHRSQRI